VPRDLDGLNRLARESKAHWGYTEAQLDRWAGDLTTRPDTLATWPTVVAVADGQLAGFAQVDPTREPWDLVSLWIRPAFMGRRIGATLLREVRALARRAGVQAIHIDADPNALGFYRACGAIEIGAVPAPIEGQPSRVRPQLRLPVRGA
jgi:GNAT superfamily N-acetyltransferase